MRNATIYLWSKKVHRYLVLVMVILTVIMAGTGYMMHEGTYVLLPAAQIRTMHDTFSIMFTIILGLMSLTGIYLFLFPYFPIPKTNQK